MRPLAFVCDGCLAHTFPARLRCHRCGSMRFTTDPISTAEVTAVTRVHRVPAGCPHDHLVELRAMGGLSLLAVADFAPNIGSRVQPVARDDGAIVISRPDPEERSSHD